MSLVDSPPTWAPHGVISGCSFLEEQPINAKTANNTNKYTLFMFRVTKLHIFLDIQAKSSTFAMIFNQNEEICYE